MNRPQSSAWHRRILRWVVNAPLSQNVPQIDLGRIDGDI